MNAENNRNNNYLDNLLQNYSMAQRRYEQQQPRQRQRQNQRRYEQRYEQQVRLLKQQLYQEQPLANEAVEVEDAEQVVGMDEEVFINMPRMTIYYSPWQNSRITLS